jgi:hypothetical protein
MGRWVCSVLVSLTCWLSGVVAVQAVAVMNGATAAVVAVATCTLLMSIFLLDQRRLSLAQAEPVETLKALKESSAITASPHQLTQFITPPVAASVDLIPVTT